MDYLPSLLYPEEPGVFYLPPKGNIPAMRRSACLQERKVIVAPHPAQAFHGECSRAKYVQA
jgi:hypothetical protein